MSSRPVSLRIPEDVRNAIQDTVRRTGRDFSSVANEMLNEAVKMRRVPGIVFADSASGRVARVAGTGLGVFEVVRSYRDLGGNWDRLRQTYHWLTEHQIRAALAYASVYPGEIDERLTDEDALTPEEIWSRFPFTKPRSR